MTVTLADARPGEPFRILRIPDPRTRAQCIRVGLGEGTVVDAVDALVLGPVVIRVHDREICVGSHLARRILIAPDGAPGATPGPRRP